MPRLKLILAGSVLGVAMATSAVAAGTSSEFPGLPWNHSRSIAQFTDGSVTVEGATFQVNAIYGDPEQTVVSYVISGSPADGPTGGGIAGGARLVLEDGTVLPLRWNAAEPTNARIGSLVFPALPRGDIQVRLEVDELNFATRSVAKRLTIPLRIDTTEGYAGSARAQQEFKGGSGDGAVTIRSVSRTPMSTVVRGTFDGLSAPAIQSMGRLDVWLTGPSGERVETDSGRFGFGDGYREFEMRFANVGSGAARIEFSNLPSADGRVTSFELAIP